MRQQTKRPGAAEEAARMPKEAPRPSHGTRGKENTVAASRRTNPPNVQRTLGLKPPLRLRRFALGKLLASGRTRDFAAYHKRFAHTDAQTSCQCGKDKILSEGASGTHQMDTWLANSGYFGRHLLATPPRDDDTE